MVMFVLQWDNICSFMEDVERQSFSKNCQAITDERFDPPKGRTFVNPTTWLWNSAWLSTDFSSIRINGISFVWTSTTCTRNMVGTGNTLVRPSLVSARSSPVLLSSAHAVIALLGGASWFFGRVPVRAYLLNVQAVGSLVAIVGCGVYVTIRQDGFVHIVRGLRNVLTVSAESRHDERYPTS